jgi:methylated-DNA-protein-cysteine methyltransferase-like protein
MMRPNRRPCVVKQEQGAVEGALKVKQEKVKQEVKRERIKQEAKLEVKQEVKQEVMDGDPEGTPRDFPWRVLQVVKAIPIGCVAAYGQCAALAGAPRNARQVGKLLGDGLATGIAPWQRVVNSSGAITIPAAAGRDQQQTLLLSEGVRFRPNGKVEAASFWRPSEQEKDLMFR